MKFTLFYNFFRFLQKMDETLVEKEDYGEPTEKDINDPRNDHMKDIVDPAIGSDSTKDSHCTKDFESTKDNVDPAVDFVDPSEYLAVNVSVKEEVNTDNPEEMKVIRYS